MRFEHRSVIHEKVSLSAKINVADGPFMKFLVFKVPVSVCEIFKVTSDVIGHQNYPQMCCLKARYGFTKGVGDREAARALSFPPCSVLSFVWDQIRRSGVGGVRQSVQNSTPYKYLNYTETLFQSKFFKFTCSRYTRLRSAKLNISISL